MRQLNCFQGILLCFFIVIFNKHFPITLLIYKIAKYLTCESRSHQSSRQRTPTDWTNWSGKQSLLLALSFSLWRGGGGQDAGKTAGNYGQSLSPSPLQQHSFNPAAIRTDTGNHSDFITHLPLSELLQNWTKSICHLLHSVPQILKHLHIICDIC